MSGYICERGVKTLKQAASIAHDGVLVKRRGVKEAGMQQGRMEAVPKGRIKTEWNELLCLWWTEAHCRVRSPKRLSDMEKPHAVTYFIFCRREH